MGKIRILIADDHGLIRQGIRNVLESYENIDIVGEAYDGPSLTAALESLSPDILLIDVTMPDFDPIAAVIKIRENHIGVKILIISAYDDDVYVKGLFSAGANGYHLKSQPLPELKMAIDQIWAGEKWLSSPLVNKLINDPSPNKAVPALTTRQADLLRLLQQGLDNQTIALRLKISVKTVENNLTRLYRFLNIQSRLEAVNFVIQHPEILSQSSTQHHEKESYFNARINPPVNVLLVDDNSRFRCELRQMINIICARAMVYEAENIAESIQLINHITPGLILVDMILGKENGIQCTRQLIKHSPSSRIILISAYPDREFHRLGLEAGAMAFLDKKDMDLSSLRQILADRLV
jgi:DNA-binding NarL/FixJ family response regulator